MVRALLLAALAAATEAASVTITVDPKNVTHKVNPFWNGCHSDSGYTHQPRGLYAQMVLGESFEGLKPSNAESVVAAGPHVGPFPTGKTVSLAPLSSAATLLRHCSFEVFVADCPCDQDMDFTVVPALNKVAGSVSFQSTNYPAKYITASGDGHTKQSNRVMVLDVSDKDAASFSVEAGLSDPTKFSFKTHGTKPAVAGGYLTAATKASGTCAGGANKGDIIVSKTVTNKAAATWETHSHPPPPPRPPPPPPPKNPWASFSTAVGTAEIVSTTPFHGKDSLALTMTAGKGIVGMSNRGLGHEGERSAACPRSLG